VSEFVAWFVVIRQLSCVRTQTEAQMLTSNPGDKEREGNTKWVHGDTIRTNAFVYRDLTEVIFFDPFIRHNSS
jgi:hypothetical protein